MKHLKFKAIFSLVLMIVLVGSMLSVVSHAEEEITYKVLRNNPTQSEEANTSGESSTIPLVTDKAALTYNEETEYMEAEAYLYINEKYSLETVLQLINDNLRYSYWEADNKNHCLHSYATIVESKQSEERYINELIPEMLKKNGMGDAIIDSKISINTEKLPDIISITVKTTTENLDNVSAYIENSKELGFETIKNDDSITVSFSNSNTSLREKFAFKEGLVFVAGKHNITVNEIVNPETTTNKTDKPTEQDETDNTENDTTTGKPFYFKAIYLLIAFPIVVLIVMIVDTARKKKQ